MDTYYDEEGNRLGSAWSTATCTDANKGVEHKPHSHDPEFAFFGPYMCEGFPPILLFDTKPRKPVNR